jgi:hypothetical protein
VAVRATTSDGKTMDAPKLTWSSAQPSIAGVSANGTVTGKAEGQTRITVSSGSATASVDVIVSRPTPASVAIVASTSSLKVGESTTLTARVRDRAGQALVYAAAWRSSNPSVASVDSSGTVRGVRRGDAIVYAVAGGATDSVRVSVTAPTPVVAATPTPVPASTTYSPGTTTPPRSDERPREPAVANDAGNASVREVDAALVSAAQSIASGFARGQLGQLTATPAFAKSVREDTPRMDGALQVRRRTVGDGKAEGEVTVPLRWRNFAGRDKSGTVVLAMTLELQGGTWRVTSARNITQP